MPLTESFAQVGSSCQSSLVSPASISSISSGNHRGDFGLLLFFFGPSVQTPDVAGERTEGTRSSSPRGSAELVHWVESLETAILGAGRSHS